MITPQKITIHNTSNSNSGENAVAHSKFVREKGYYEIVDKNTGQKQKMWVSWHYTVDDTIAIKQLPDNEKAFHAGPSANSISIAIEICMHAGINHAAANERAAQLTALLCHDLSIPLTGVVTHNEWTGKNCPVLLLPMWEKFKKQINFYLTELNASTVPQATFAFGSASTSQDASVLCWTETEESFDTSRYRYPVQEAYNDSFLKGEEVVLPVSKMSIDLHFIHHQNMSIYFSRQRKLALYTACNYDKDLLFEEVKRSNSFRNDTQIDNSYQLGKGFYKSTTLRNPTGKNYFDQGHLIARRYNQWGANVEEAKRSERDTYYYTNMHPQVPELNQDEWEKLESFIIEKGKLDTNRVSIFAGALLMQNDPVATYIDKFYQWEQGIQIPQAFWKIIYYRVDGKLRKISFLMSQRKRMRELPFVAFGVEAPFMEDPFDLLPDSLKTFIVKSDLIEFNTKLSFTPAEELYNRSEPLEVILDDNETYDLSKAVSNILQFV